ncbi:hypothetical protein Tco_0506948 [Tanacetum coccineum]
MRSGSMLWLIHRMKRQWMPPLLASSSSPNVIVALSVEKEKENAPHNSQDTPMIPLVDAKDASASSRV